MHSLVLLVLQFQCDDRQAVEKENEVNLGVRIAKEKMWAESEAVLGVILARYTLFGTRFGIVELEFQPAHFQAMSDKQPEWRVLQFVSQRTKHLIARICAVVFRQLLYCF